MNTHKHTCSEAHTGKQHTDMNRHMYEHTCTLIHTYTYKYTNTESYT